MASGSMIYIPSLMKAGKGVQQLLGVISGHTHSKLNSCILLVFKNMEIGQKGKGTTHRYRAKIYI
jgi:hypothetical protein